MLYHQYFDNDLGFKGADAIYWGPASFRPQSVDVTLAKHSINGNPFPELLLSTKDQSQTPCSGSKPRVSFLSLPLEIRRMVYGYVHEVNPIKYRKLMDPSEVTRSSPWYPRMPLKACIYKRVTLKAIEEIPLGETHPTQRNEAPLLHPHRPFAGLPSSLLRANKQIYYDCREYPLLESEFVFFTYFSSGLWTAYSFTKRLQPWQRDCMRYIRLELMSTDLQGACDQEWQELCGFLSQGVRGLRLKILGVVTASQTSNVVAKVIGQSKPTVQIKDAEGRVAPWIERGLKCLRKLERIEVELLIPNWDDCKKLEWCHNLEETLNNPHGVENNYIRVTCVEKVEG